MALGLSLAGFGLANSVDAQDFSSGILCGPGTTPPESPTLRLDKDTVEKSDSAIVRGDYGEAIRILRPLADAGNAQAQYNLATFYDDGLAVVRDPKQAVQWYKLSAEQGYPRAEFNLGVHYVNGQGTSQDYEKAASWIRKSADGGIVAAQFGLSRLYIEGMGVPRDYGAALMWSLKAADHGLAEAQFTLFILYAEGRPGVPRDDVKALMWADLALGRFTPKEADRRQVAQRDRDKLAAGLSAGARTAAENLERAWLADHKPCPLEKDALRPTSHR
jgi:hypothetical protein